MKKAVRISGRGMCPQLSINPETCQFFGDKGWATTIKWSVVGHKRLDIEKSKIGRSVEYPTKRGGDVSLGGQNYF